MIFLLLNICMTELLTLFTLYSFLPAEKKHDGYSLYTARRQDRRPRWSAVLPGPGA
jgi:hypothetical protein